jgi:hypothetical protein
VKIQVLAQTADTKSMGAVKLIDVVNRREFRNFADIS